MDNNSSRHCWMMGEGEQMSEIMFISPFYTIATNIPMIIQSLLVYSPPYLRHDLHNKEDYEDRHCFIKC